MLTLICGIPNSGKTTYSKKFENVVHLDEVEPVNGSYTEGVRVLVSETLGDICVEGLYCTSRDRKKLLDKYHGERTKCIWIDTPLDVCISREDRDRATVLIRNCAQIFEPPAYDEGWNEIQVIHNY